LNYETTYYALLMSGESIQDASGLARRRISSNGVIDEALRSNLKWQPDSVIVQWEYGDVGVQLLEITEEEANALIDRFRKKWAGADE
jgi:hypothetical protein